MSRPIFSDPSIEAELAEQVRGWVLFLGIVRDAVKIAVSEANSGVPKYLFHIVMHFGARILAFPEVVTLLVSWEDTIYNSQSKEERAKIEKWLAHVGTALGWIGKGNVEHLTDDEREAIVADYKKWRPICERLNTEFKRFWKAEKARPSTESNREEFRKRMANEFKIAVADVQAIQWRLKKRSRKASKSSPTETICHIVAREHPGIGEKTIENIWRDYLKEHPGEKRRRRKAPTTSSADERTL